MKKILKLSAIATALFILIPIKAEAKAFGTEENTETREIGGGYCQTTHYRKYNFFWITIYSDIDYRIHECDNHSIM